MNIFSAVLLAALAAAPASAQVVRFSLTAPVNPVMGLPKSLPSPLSGPLAGGGVTLPTPLYGITAPVALAAAPAAAPAAIPVSFPAPAAPLAPLSVTARLPRVAVEAGRENKRNPFSAVLPDSTIRFDESAPKSEKTGEDGDKDRLDQTFDGNGRVSQRRAPLISSRRHTLPEADLENELGLGR